MPILFATTLLLGAVLLFAVQPMIGKLLLPKLGGSPAVWNTCLVFFQGVLLLGYLYSHLMTRFLTLRAQAFAHLGLLAVVVFALPIAIRSGSPDAESPAIWLFGALAASVGLPFFVVSTTSPLVQRWYASTQSIGAADPYFLSVASNLGCLLALLGYPVLIEPTLRLSEQSEWWCYGYFGYAALVAICAGSICFNSRRSITELTIAEERPWTGGKPKPLLWIALAFVPSSLLVGVTNAITIDIAPIPLLWIIPLSLYLLTFIIAFAPGVRLPLKRLGKALAMCTLFLGLGLLTGATEPLWVVLALHLITFFVAALVCHGRLAAERPPVKHLTSFYLWMSLGGVLGGAFNALLAPVLFHRLGFVEYPLALVIVCLFRPVSAGAFQFRLRDLVAPLVLGSFALALILTSQIEAVMAPLRDLSKSWGIEVDVVRRAACFGVPLILNFLLVERPWRFSFALAALFLAGSVDVGEQGRVLYLERNFLGVVKITETHDGEFTAMVHGNTVHGQQRNSPRPRYIASFLQPLGSGSALNEASIVATADGRWDDRHRPLTYYHPTGPAGVTFRYLVDGWSGSRRIGAVGLGTGALASYARPNQDWTFFELDPAVEKLARDDRYFTFLRDSAARSLKVVIGDARLRLADEPDGSFDLLVLDAFSSDAIPIHLLTAEAFALYERKLAPRGVILLHLSNRYLDLPQVVVKVAETASPPLIVRENTDIAERDNTEGKSSSSWVILARHSDDFGPLQRATRGFTPAKASNAPRWTDDRADLLGAFRRNED